MSEEIIIRVNFGKPMALFPLNATALMPHEQVPLLIFEPRYRQMLEHALDGPGQIAMATFQGPRWRQEYHGKPPIRPAVCVGQIEQHVRNPDGSYAVLLRGICRARVINELRAEDDLAHPALLYRRAMLEPVGVDPPDEDVLEDYRRRLGDALEHTPLSGLRHAGDLAKHAKNEDVPASIIIEMLGLSYVTDSELRYKLLATGDAEQRAKILTTHLTDLEGLLRKAEPQRHRNNPPPRGVTLN